MKFKPKHIINILLLLSHILFPYAAGIVFFGWGRHIRHHHIRVVLSVFGSSALGLAAIAIGILFAVCARKKETETAMKCVLISKCIHLLVFLYTANYTIISIIGYGSFGLILLFGMVNTAMLIVTCSFPIAVLIRAKKAGLISAGAAGVASICQLVVFLDLISFLIVYATREKPIEMKK